MARAERVLVWGAGGHGRVVADVVRAAGHQVIGWVDRNQDLADPRLVPTNVLSERELLDALASGALPLNATAMALGLGGNSARADAHRRLGASSAPPFAHPSASVSPSAELGSATMIMPHAVVNANARIGAAVIVNSGAIVEHDCVLGFATHVSPNACLAGAVRVAERAWIGAGAVVLPNLSIGRDAVVGAGAVVTRDVQDGETVAGVPARIISATQTHA